MAKKAKKTKEETKAGVRDFSILLLPVVTEKTSHVGSGGNTVVFKVDRRASKDEIKSAVQRVYNVGVNKVRTVSYLGKPKRTAKSSGRRAGFKKAYVTLAEGQSIDVVEGL